MKKPKKKLKRQRWIIEGSRFLWGYESFEENLRRDISIEPSGGGLWTSNKNTIFLYGNESSFGIPTQSEILDSIEFEDIFDGYTIKYCSDINHYVREEKEANWIIIRDDNREK